MSKVNSIILGNYLADLDSAETAENEFLVTSDYICRLGFDGLLYSYIPSLVIDKGLEIQPVFNASEAYTNKFLDHYQQAGFSEHDFTLKRICSGFEETMDWWNEEECKAISNDERAVIEVAKEDHGIANGVSFATMINSTGVAGVSMVSESKRPQFKLLNQDSFHTARVIVQTYNNRTLASIDGRKIYTLSILEKLNQTDKKVLRYIVEHKTMSRVEDVTGVSVNYANRVLERLKAKLGCQSKQELTYYCGLLGILDFI